MLEAFQRLLRRGPGRTVAETAAQDEVRDSEETIRAEITSTRDQIDEAAQRPTLKVLTNTQETMAALDEAFAGCKPPKKGESDKVVANIRLTAREGEAFTDHSATVLLARLGGTTTFNLIDDPLPRSLCFRVGHSTYLSLKGSYHKLFDSIFQGGITVTVEKEETNR